MPKKCSQEGNPTQKLNMMKGDKSPVYRAGKWKNEREMLISFKHAKYQMVWGTYLLFHLPKLRLPGGI